jgi:hypothetical protein
MSMPEFKPISHDSIPAALEKAERYRLLNEPAQAESICRDVLAVDPENQRALVSLLLALTEQFLDGPPDCYHQAVDAAKKLHGEYERFYYHGIVCERRGYACAVRGGPGSREQGYEWIREAMRYFEQAEPLRPAGNDDSLLRWNCCVRMRQRYHLAPAPEAALPPLVGDD